MTASTSDHRPTAVMIGSIGKLPLGGISYFCLHYLVGLLDLGYRVHYLERQNWPGELYDPNTGMTDDPGYALGYLESLMPRFGFADDAWSFIDLAGHCHGSGWTALREALDRADFLLTVANPTWFDELERCPRRAFVDGDPMFTQVAMTTGQGHRAHTPSHYGALFTYGTRIGQPDCAIPAAGRTWIPTRPVVATRLWEAAVEGDGLPVTALLHWAAGDDLAFQGRTYGHKDREFEKFIDLPRHTPQPLVIAADGQAPRERLAASGWGLASPLAASRTADDFRRFLAGSRADLGIAKHAYVATRSGWFSDRSTCYLAAGRPVLHQETGFSDWLPAGDGVLPFSTVEEIVEGLRRLDLDYPRHARAARATAEEHFEATRVLGRMLDQAGFR